jgi:acyl-CoA dehydrogenase
MNFDFSPEQEQFRDQLRRMLERADGRGQGRRILEKQAEHYSSSIWQGLAELGVQAAAIPEKHAGLGLGPLELCVAAEEIGRVLAPIPFLSSIGLCAEAIRLFGSAQRARRSVRGDSPRTISRRVRARRVSPRGDCLEPRCRCSTAWPLL